MALALPLSVPTRRPAFEHGTSKPCVVHISGTLIAPKQSVCTSGHFSHGYVSKTHHTYECQVRALKAPVRQDHLTMAMAGYNGALCDGLICLGEQLEECMHACMMACGAGAHHPAL